MDEDLAQPEKNNAHDTVTVVSPPSHIDPQIDTIAEMPMASEAQKDLRMSHKLIGLIIGIIVTLIAIIAFGVIGFFVFRNDIMDRRDSVVHEMQLNMHDAAQQELVKKTLACQTAVRDGYMGNPIVESELDGMHQELNDILTTEGSDLSLTLEEACLFIVITNDAANSADVQDLADVEVIMKNALAYMSTYNMSQGVLQKISSVSEIVQRHAQNEASNAYVKSLIASTVPGMILCMDGNDFLMDPIEGQEMCREKMEYGLWPTISDRGARWGGCAMQVERVGGIVEHVSYCATLANGIVVTCSEDGCDFNNDKTDDLVIE